MFFFHHFSLFFTWFPMISPFFLCFPRFPWCFSGHLLGQRPGSALAGTPRLHDLRRAAPLATAVALQRLLAAAHPGRAHAGAAAPEAGGRWEIYL